MKSYHFGVPSWIVWMQHIIIGILLIYVGYIGINKGIISRNMSIVVLVLGVLAALYHLHLWLFISHDKHNKHT